MFPSGHISATHGSAVEVDGASIVAGSEAAQVLEAIEAAFHAIEVL